MFFLKCKMPHQIIFVEFNFDDSPNVIYEFKFDHSIHSK